MSNLSQSGVIDRHIQEHLDGHQDYSTIFDGFIYLFGPYMVMTSGYEEIGDKIARRNHLMRFMQFAGYITRLSMHHVESQSSKLDIANDGKSFIVEVDNTFDGKEADALKRLASGFFGTESIMTSVAPIVPYPSMPSGVYKPMRQVIDTVETWATKPSAEELNSLLLSSTYHILTHSSNVYLGSTTEQLQDMLMSTSGELKMWEKYYILASLYYNNRPGLHSAMESNTLYRDNSLTPVIAFYKALTSLDNPMNFPVFENYIHAIENVIPTPSLEDWEDPLMTEKENSNVEELLPNRSVAADRDKEAEYNLNGIYNFIATHIFMQFDDWCTRYFETELRDNKIVNVNFLLNDARGYELESKHFVVPFTDLRDWKVKFIVTVPDQADPYIVDNIAEFAAEPASEGWFTDDLREERLDLLKKKNVIVVFSPSTDSYGGVKDIQRYIDMSNAHYADHFGILEGTDNLRFTVTSDALYDFGKTFLTEGAPFDLPKTLRKFDAWGKAHDTLVFVSTDRFHYYSHTSMREYPIIVLSTAKIPTAASQLIKREHSLSDVYLRYKYHSYLSDKMPEKFLVKDLSKIHLFHLSQKKFTKLIPRITSKPMKFENKGIQRISAADSVKGCVRGLSDAIEYTPYKDPRNPEITGIAKYYVYQLQLSKDTRVAKPTKKFLPDVDVTGEYWVLDPVPVKCLGVLTLYQVGSDGWITDNVDLIELK